MGCRRPRRISIHRVGLLLLFFYSTFPFLSFLFRIHLQWRYRHGRRSPQWRLHLIRSGASITHTLRVVVLHKFQSMFSSLSFLGFSHPRIRQRRGIGRRRMSLIPVFLFHLTRWRGLARRGTLSRHGTRSRRGDGAIQRGGIPK